MAGVTPHQKSQDRLLQLPQWLVRNREFQNCVRRLITEKTALFDAVWGSARALIVAALAKMQHPAWADDQNGDWPGFPTVLAVTPTDQALDDLYDDLESFWPDRIERFPAYETLRAEHDGIDLNLGDRLRILKRLNANDVPALMLTSIQALLQKVPATARLQQNSRRLAVGQREELEPLKEWLVARGFAHVTAVEMPGEFSVRGGIMDLFAPDWSQPVRIEWFDDQLESIRHFDLQTQRSSQTIDDIEVTLLDESPFADDLLLDYLPPQSLIVLIEPDEGRQTATQFIARHDHSSALASIDKLQRRWSEFPVATMYQLAAGDSSNTWRMASEPIETFRGDSTEVRLQLDQVAQDCDVVVVARVDGEIPRLQEILQTTAIAANGRLEYAVGCIHQGFRWRDRSLVVVGCDQMFHRGQLRRASRRRLGKAIDSFVDLRDGDLVVHLAHGIGRYRGLKLLEKAGLLTEHLEIEFHGGTRIFVPATKIDLVQKYIGGTKTRPMLARIGGKSWVKQKQATEAAITDLAAEMLEVQAHRSSRTGIAFGPDTVWQHEFEQSFPYRETADQLQAIGAIKRDMQSPRPMDRLLCGDVGFGKTEVAIRATFKAVESGYQVAVLVPTTILAEQHYRTFCERLVEFPFDIAKLSRFSSSTEIKETLEKLATGQLDVVIGTHRLVSGDVRFHNLGLVIIDEEQRFGVHHKERLKTMRADVDILTMSATPIPRTLHMSLVGVRDISNLETAPDERMAIETHCARFNATLIRQAILREINRGGQVYFVHNRVEDIELLKLELQSIVPEASIVVGHAQMPDEQLDRVMTEFIEGKYDVLLSTTIVESGLDIPNANTMIIDEADRYGLAELHQLRGRVGRYKHRAYCYLLIRPHKHINPTAAKRLQAIETFSELGAGFAIAMRDLEIRGAGNLLGTEQSGHIATVGYELYCQMLETAVRKLKHQPQKISVHVDIDLPAVAYLPDEYVADRRQKIDFYRRMTRVESFEQIKQLRAELIDRFGQPPAPVDRLLQLAEIKLEAAIWQIDTIFMQERYLGFKYRDRRRIDQLASKHSGTLRVVDEQNAFVTLKTENIDTDRLLALLKAILNPK